MRPGQEQRFNVWTDPDSAYILLYVMLQIGGRIRFFGIYGRYQDNLNRTAVRERILSD